MMEELTLLNKLSFWLLSGLMLVGALGVVFNRSIVYSALSLLVAFLAIAGVFVLLNAPFIGAAQILVYGVGLTIVLIFGIMLTGDKPFVDPVGQERPIRYWLLPAAVSSGLLGFMLWAILMPNFQLTAINGLFTAKVDPIMSASELTGLQAILTDGGITHIGQLLFSKFLVPFELASVLLLLAMVGAIILSKRVFPEEEGMDTVTGKPTLEQALQASIQQRNLSIDDMGDVVSEKETLGVP